MRFSAATRRLVVVATCVALALGFAFHLHHTTLRVVTVSGPSPFRACAAGGLAFVGAEVEPSIAVDPTNRNHLLIVYQQDRYTDGAARGIVSARSNDGGKSWTRTPLPIGACAQSALPAPFRVSDPWVSFGGDGRAYALGSNVAVSSGDGGRTWVDAVALAQPSPSYILDKGSLTADPVRSGVAYATWARYLRAASGGPVQSDAMFAKTTNGGKSWSTPTVIARHGVRAGPIASVIVPDPERHRLYHFAFWQVGPIPEDRSSRLFVQSSRDGGGTWSAMHTISTVGTVGENATDPTSGRTIRTGFVVPSFAVDRSNGELYAVWQDDQFANSRFDQVAFSRSADGLEWSKPALISSPSKQAFVPVIAAAAGKVGVTFFELPARRGTPSGKAQYWFLESTDRGKSWQRRRVGVAFSIATAPLLAGDEALLVPPGLFLGDYMGLAADARSFQLAFVTANPSMTNRTDVRYARVAR